MENGFYSQKYGIGGGDPVMIWNSIGFGVLPEGTILTKLCLQGRLSSDEIDTIEVQLWEQGDFTLGGYDAGTMNAVKILDTVAVDMDSAEMRNFAIDLGEYRLSEKRAIIPVIRGTLVGGAVPSAPVFFHGDIWVEWM